MADSKTLPVRMLAEVHEKIRLEAAAKNISMNAVVMEAINEKYSRTSRLEKKIDKILKALSND